jgi:hypothetical protein
MLHYPLCWAPFYYLGEEFCTDMFLQVGSQISQMKMEWAGGLTWQSYNEDINSLGEESFTTIGLL